MKKSAKWGLSLAGGVAILGVLFFFVDVRRLASILAHSVWPYLILVVAADVAVLALKAKRWQIIAGGAGDELRFWPMFKATVVGFWGNVVLPARAGDIGRGLYVAKQQDTTKASGLGTVALDKAMDAFSLVVLIAPLAVVGHIPEAFRQGVRATVALAAVVFVASYVLAARYGKRDVADQQGRFKKVLVGLANGFATMRQGRRFLAAYLVSVLSWLLQVGMLVWTAQALHIPMGWAEAALVLVGLNLVVFLPGTPGNVGTAHAAIVVTMGLLGFGRTEALSEAIVYHGLQVVVLFVLGPALLRGLRAEARRRSTSIAVEAGGDGDGPNGKRDAGGCCGDGSVSAAGLSVTAQ